MAINTPKSKDNDDLDIGLLLNTLIALRRGDFETRMPNDWTGLLGRVMSKLALLVSAQHVEPPGSKRLRLSCFCSTVANHKICHGFCQNRLQGSSTLHSLLLF